MAVDVEIPGMGESVAEAVLIEWLKGDGERVERDEPICVLETDKANVDLPSPAAGILRHLTAVDESVEVGDVIARVDGEGEAGGGKAEPAASAEHPEREEEPAAAAEQGRDTEAPRPADAEDAAEPPLSPAVRRLVEEHGLDPAAVGGTGKEGRITKGDVLQHVEERRKAAATDEPDTETAPPSPPPAPQASQRPAPAPETPARARPRPASAVPAGGGDGVRREPMSRIRQRIARHLVAAQQNAAMLTTFNEVDMSAVMALRAQYKERFSEVHGVSLGLMSFFSRAVVLALQEFPTLNAWIEGDEIVYHDYVNLGIAVSTERGLLVPVLHHAEALSMADVESEIKRLAAGARDNRLNMDDLSGGTFTITNGGVFGSLLSTPILNAPQSGILGMHAIQQRPVAVNGQVEIRPMMYVALSYDHRLVDGQQSVSFLVRVKQLVEDPARLLLQL